MNLVFGVLLADPSFWIGLTAVWMFGWTRFGDRRWDEDEVDPRIPTSSFTTRFRFLLAAFTYTGAYGLLYAVLIGCGSFEFTQEILKKYIGTIGDKQIGSPAWAAMAVTAVLPALPLFKRLDERLRAKFHNFASIPLKVRHLADEILYGLSQLLGITDGGDMNDGARLYSRLKKCMKKLKASPRVTAARDYGEFFAQYRSVKEELDKQVEAANAADGADGEKAKEQEQVSSFEWQALNKRLARLIACAVLHVERDEYDARDVLANELKIPHIAAGHWRFTFNQIALGGVAVILAIGIGLGAGAYVTLSKMGFRPDHSHAEVLMAMYRQCATIGILAGPMFVLSIMFAAGVQMYLLDRRQFGQALEWQDLTLSRIITFVGAFLVALLPALIVGAIRAWLRNEELSIMVWLPWAIPPAAVATLFVSLSSHELTPVKALNTAVDFVAHAAVAAIATLIAAKISMLAGFNPLASFGVPPDSFVLTAEMTAALAGGTLGCIECAVSRPAKQGAARPKPALVPAAA
jgi:hypothetical protein